MGGAEGIGFDAEEVFLISINSISKAVARCRRGSMSATAAEAIVPKSTAPESMLDAIGISAMDSIDVMAAGTVGAEASRAAIVSIGGAAGQSDESGQREKRREPRPSAVGHRRAGMSVEKFSVHGLWSSWVDPILQPASFSNCCFSAGVMWWDIATMV